jgi:hypothetical protein
MMTALVMPLHDPQGIMFPHLFVILDSLKALFGMVHELVNQFR